MVKTIPAVVARNQWGRILERVKKNQERFVVSRKGDATAVILGYEDFMRSILRIKEPVILRKIRDGARRSEVSKLTVKQINAEILAVRAARRKEQNS